MFERMHKMDKTTLHLLSIADIVGKGTKCFMRSERIFAPSFLLGVMFPKSALACAFMLVINLLVMNLELCQGFQSLRFGQVSTSERGLFSQKPAALRVLKSSSRQKQMLLSRDSAREEQLKQCRSTLLELVDLKQSRKSRLSVEETLERMILLKPCIGVQDVKILGTWRLLWSSQTADVNPFQKPSQVAFERMH